MESSNFVDMSLDEIIKMNKKTQQAGAAKKRIAAKKLANKRTALRPALAKNMKSRKNVAAQALFLRAKRTAAIAAKVAADAARLAAPSRTLGQKSSPVVAGSASRKRNLLAKRRMLAKNNTIRQQNKSGVQDLRNRLNNRRQQSFNRQIRPVNRRSFNQSDRAAPRFMNGRFANRPNRNNRIAMNGANSSRRGRGRSVDESYRQYIQQARALIRAQQEMRQVTVTRNRQANNSNRNIFVDVPRNNRGGNLRGGNQYRGRRGGNRFVR